MVVFEFSANIFAENSKIFAESGHHGHPLLECMATPEGQQTKLSKLHRPTYQNVCEKGTKPMEKELAK